jgi:predicted enzyme related to lactoylglutathione lyase
MFDRRANKYIFPWFLLYVFLLLPISSISAPVLPPLNSTPTGKQLTGKFIWFDLATSEFEKQKAFYGAVFGWTFRPIGNTNDDYTLIINGDHNVAGMFEVKPKDDAKAGALWIGLMSTADPDKAVKTAEQGGGAIHAPTMTVAQRGTYALLRDPEGALFGVMKSDSGDPPDKTAEIGDFLWMDLFANQPEKAGEFYQQLAGYELTKEEIKDDNVDRLFLNSQGKARAGIVPLPKDANRAGWLPYVKVADVNETLKKVTDAGGMVMVAPDEDLLDGNLAIFSDPQGGVLGIVKWDEPSTDEK